MALLCKIIGHKWQGCKCRRKNCIETRNEGHEFGEERDADCKATCKICGYKATGHIWVMETGRCQHCNKAFDEISNPDFDVFWKSNIAVLADRTLDDPNAAHNNNELIKVYVKPYYKHEQKKHSEQRMELRKKLETGKLPTYREAALYGYSYSTHVLAGAKALKKASEKFQNEVRRLTNHGHDTSYLIIQHNVLQTFSQEIDIQLKLLTLLCTIMGLKGDTPELFEAIYNLGALTNTNTGIPAKTEIPTAPVKDWVIATTPEEYPLFSSFSGVKHGGVCDVCAKPLQGSDARIVPNEVFYGSKKYRDHRFNFMSSLAGGSRAQSDAELDNQQSSDKSPGS
ncbi:MAG: hypothetical protein LBI27_07170, partial [Clostridiales bacterium]|nr:hypothetical protein [Clostridiales bacterium]